MSIEPINLIYKITLVDLSEEHLHEFISRIVTEDSRSHKETIGMGISKKDISMYNKFNIRFIIWDVSPNERYRSLLTQYLNDSKAIIFYITNLSNNNYYILDRINWFLSVISNVLKSEFIPIFLVYNPDPHNTASISVQDIDHTDDGTRINNQTSNNYVQNTRTFDMNSFFLNEGEKINKNLLDICSKYGFQAIIKLNSQDDPALLYIFGLISQFSLINRPEIEEYLFQTENKLMVEKQTGSLVSPFKNEYVSILLFLREMITGSVQYSYEIWPQMERLLENIELLDFYNFYGVRESSSKIIKNDKQFQRFLKMGRKCPICGKENEVSYLQNFYLSKYKEKIAIKESVLYLMDELDLEGLNTNDSDNDSDNNSVYIMDSNKIRIGIPCCDCYKKYFG